MKWLVGVALLMNENNIDKVFTLEPALISNIANIPLQSFILKPPPASIQSIRVH